MKKILQRFDKWSYDFGLYWGRRFGLYRVPKRKGVSAVSDLFVSSGIDAWLKSGGSLKFSRKYRIAHLDLFPFILRGRRSRIDRSALVQLGLLVLVLYIWIFYGFNTHSSGDIDRPILPTPTARYVTK